MPSKSLAFVVSSLIALTGAACSGQEPHRPAWAALTERGLGDIALKPGSNVRVFNEVDLENRDFIAYDQSTGYLTLQPGTYRCDGWSLTTFGYELTPEQRAARFSAPGYAFFYNLDTERIEILGSMQDPLDSQPSIIDGVIRVQETTRYYLAHQNGKNVDGVSLQIFEPDVRMPDGSPSTNHAFAQLVVERL